MKVISNKTESAPPIFTKARVKHILNKNSDKNFVKRIVNPEKYPVMNNEDGSYSTHLMAWSNRDDNPKKRIVYPTIVHDEKTNKLTKLSDDDAYDYAVKNKEYVEFNSDKKADWFSRNYKAVWKK